MAGQSPSATHLYHLAAVYVRLGQRDAASEKLNLVLESGARFPEREEAERLAAQLR